MKLDEMQLSQLLQDCFNRDDMSPEEKKDFAKDISRVKKQFFKYCIDRAEIYPSSHSMRYTIMRDATKALFNID